MKNCTFTDKDGKQYRRITKAMAKKLYNDGKTIVLCPCNLRPFTMWHVEFSINISDDGDVKNDFDMRVMHFVHYNCTCNETGRYTAFYTPVND